MLHFKSPRLMKHLVALFVKLSQEMLCICHQGQCWAQLFTKNIYRTRQPFWNLPTVELLECTPQQGNCTLIRLLIPLVTKLNRTEIERIIILQLWSTYICYLFTLLHNISKGNIMFYSWFHFHSKHKISFNGVKTLHVMM